MLITCVCVCLVAQSHKEEVIPNSLIQVSMGSKTLTFNLLSLKSNFTWSFSDKGGSMNTTLPITAQISIIFKNTVSEVYKVEPQPVYFKQTKIKSHKHQSHTEEMNKGYQICLYHVSSPQAAYSNHFQASCFGCHSTEPSPLTQGIKSRLGRISASFPHRLANCRRR